MNYWTKKHIIYKEMAGTNEHGLSNRQLVEMIMQKTGKTADEIRNACHKEIEEINSSRVKTPTTYTSDDGMRIAAYEVSDGWGNHLYYEWSE